MACASAAASERIRIRRHPERGRYDAATVHRVLDEGLVGHLAVIEDGVPYAVPMLYARDGERLYLHGSPRSRAVRAAASGADVSFTVTLLDALVLARSAFHHSLNYRSVVVVGACRVLQEPAALERAAQHLVEHAVAGRWSEVRHPDPAEYAVTSILELPLIEVSAKVRTGPPVDAARDLDLELWAGEVPLVTSVGEPVATDGTVVDVPASVQTLLRAGGRSQSVRAS